MKKCWGKEKRKHRRECRRGRPLCRWRRTRPCACAAYHFPHRPGSGRCGDVSEMDLHVYGPRKKVA